MMIMTFKARDNFLWYSKGDKINDSDKEHFKQWQEEGMIENISVSPKIEEPVANDELEEEDTVEEEQAESNLDLNGDGKVDKEDASIAAKVMNKVKHKKKSKKRR